MYRFIREKLPDLSRKYNKHLLFVVAFTSALCLWLHPELKGADITRYLYWTRTFLFDRDLLLVNEFEMYGERLLITPTGYALEFHNFGTAIFWLPFYAIAYFIDWLVHRPGEVIRTGFEPIYILLINFSTWIYAGITLLLLHRLVRRYSSNRAALWATIFVSLGTSYFYYIVFLPVSSHIVSVLLATLFLTAWEADRRRTRWQLWLAMGIIGGGLLLVANYNLPFLVLPLLTLLSDVRKNGFYNRRLKLLGIYVLSGFLTFMPQFFIWWLFFDSPLATPYSAQLSWLKSQMILSWFSTWHGLFVFSPIVFLSLAGIYYLFRRDKILAAGFTIIFFSFSYIVGTNVAWWGGTSFGARYFISLTPLFVIGLATFLNHVNKTVVYVISGMLALWTLLLYIQTALGLMNLHNWYPINRLVAGQWQVLQQLPRFIYYEARLPLTEGPLFMIVLALAVVGAIILSLGPGLARTLWSRFDDQALFVLPGLLIALIIFIGYAGLNSETARSQLMEARYYRDKQQIYTFDPFDSMKNYHKMAGFYLDHGQPEQSMTTIQAAIKLWPDQTRQVVSEDELQPLVYHSLDLNFGNVVRLIGYSLEKTEHNRLKANLYWQRLAAEVDEVYYTFSLIDLASGQKIAQYRTEEGLISPSVVGMYPLDEIPDGMLFSDRFDLSYQPGDDFGRIDISLAESELLPHLPDGATPESVTLGFIDLSASGLLHPLDYNFANKIGLTGYRTYLDETKQTLLLALDWKGVTPPENNYKIFIHLVDSDDNIITQNDVEPLSRLRPTSTWKSEEEILDFYPIPLPENASLEEATILLGLYLLETGERLFLVGPDGSPTAPPESFVRLEIK
jgi:hypothetical protein